MKFAKLLLIACLFIGGCEKNRNISNHHEASRTTINPREVELQVSLGEITLFKTVVLFSTGKNAGMTSFSSNEASGRDYAFNITVQYIGVIDMPEDVYSKQIVEGDVIAVRISRIYPKKNNMIDSKVIFVTCHGNKNKVVDGDITIVWKYKGYNN